MHLPIQEFCTSDTPAFLCVAGPSGCGKTNLLRAIQSAAEQENNDCRVLLIETHILLPYLLESFQAKAYPAFVNRLAEYDILLVDQLEELGDKYTTREEVIHLFRELLGRGVSVAVSICIRTNNPMDTELYETFESHSFSENQYAVVWQKELK